MMAGSEFFIIATLLHHHHHRRRHHPILLKRENFAQNAASLFWEPFILHLAAVNFHPRFFFSLTLNTSPRAFLAGTLMGLPETAINTTSGALHFKLPFFRCLFCSRFAQSLCNKTAFSVNFNTERALALFFLSLCST